MKTINKKKIINDPVHGFITLPTELLYDITEHPYLQRLRHIKQLGMTHLVYPGATHTRFQHALGCLHLMGAAVETLRQKGHEISFEESEAVNAAILMHDLGHGPFSHVLETVIAPDINHEEISLLMMEELNKHFNGRLELSIKIFSNTYHKKFLHQLVSGQLDMDRLDYLSRDSFFTGVSEGVISSDRIIKMLNVHDDQLVVESKGIYSIEKFLIARRLMYWQVYLHKTALVAEKMMVNIFRRARELFLKGEGSEVSPPLMYFLDKNISKREFKINPEVLANYALLDDSDIMAALKTWARHGDKILSTLATRLLNRDLLAIEIQDKPFDNERLIALAGITAKKLHLDNTDDASYFAFTSSVCNNAYSPTDDKINILFRDNTIKDITAASDMFDLNALQKIVEKQLLCYPKEVRQ